MYSFLPCGCLLSSNSCCSCADDPLMPHLLGYVFDSKKALYDQLRDNTLLDKLFDNVSRESTACLLKYWCGFQYSTNRDEQLETMIKLTILNIFPIYACLSPLHLPKSEMIQAHLDVIVSESLKAAKAFPQINLLSFYKAPLEQQGFIHLMVLSGLIALGVLNIVRVNWGGSRKLPSWITNSLAFS